MANVRVKLNLRGIDEVLKSRGVTAEVARRAWRIKQRAGDHFEMVVIPHKWTSRAYVQSADEEGAKLEARDKTLTRALDAARD